MRRLRRFTARVRNLLLRRRLGARLREEMDAHLEALEEEHLRAGVPADQARRRARIVFGSQEAASENWHAEQGLPGLEHLLADLRYTAHRLRRSPGVTLLAVVTLMLGIGANVVVFGVLNELVLQPLPVNRPRQLYQLRPRQWTDGKLLTASYPAYVDYARRNDTFSTMAALDAYARAELRWRNVRMHIAGDAVSGNYFDFLGLTPEAGRFFHAADEHGANSAPYIVLSDALWRSVFGGDRRILGKPVLLDGQVFTVIGVTRPSFHGTERFTWPDYWMPIVENGADYLTNRAEVDVTVLGRVRDGMTPMQATNNLDAISARLAQEYPLTDRGDAVRLVRPGLYGDDGAVIRGFLWGVSALALLVLAAACANLANLFAARMADRTRELALRMALGCTRLRLVRQVALEVLLVSLAGGAAALALAVAALDLLSRWRPAFGGHVEIHVSAPVYAVAVALTLCGGLGFGLLPARQVWRGSPLPLMKEAPARGRRRWSPGDVLLGGQIAICALLVCASLVAVQGMRRVLHMPLGFLPQGAVLAFTDLSTTAQPEVVLQAIVAAARALPGVTAAGAVSRTPMTGGMHGVPVFRQGTVELTRDRAALEPYVFEASPGYLRAAGTRLLRGRDLGRQDTADTPAVAVVNQTFAQRMWGRASALGRRFLVQGRLTQVVGVTENGKYHDLDEPAQPVVYLPYAQAGDGDTIFVVRSALPTGQLARALAGVVQAALPGAPLTVQGWPQSMEGVLFPSRAAAAALGAIGVLSGLLAVTGIFGMAAFAVSRRRREIGIRVALGATRTQVLRAMLGRIVVLLGAGSLSGLCAAVLLRRVLAHVVEQSRTPDPGVLCGSVAILVGLGLAAVAVPAHRALQVDAAKLLRES